MVPCIAPCGLNQPGRGLFEIEKLINRKQRNKDDYPCNEPNCNEDQNIDCLLRNAPASDGSLHQLIKNTIEKTIDNQFEKQNEKSYSYYLLLRDDINKISPEIKAELSKRDQKFDILMQALTDEDKEGQRLFSIIPFDPKFLDSTKWLKSKFQITLWCEHSRLPLTFLNPPDSKLGIYEVEISREWFTKAKPLIKTITTTLSLVLPVAASFNKFVLDENAYKTIEEQLNLGQKALESTLKSSELLINQTSDIFDDLEVGNVIEAQGSILRELHTILKQKDPNFSNLGLERVRNKQGKFLWVHPQFIGEY